MNQHYASTRKSNRTPKRLLLILALIVGCLPVMKAQTNYVFYNSTYGYLYNNNGTLTSGGLKFDKSSVWIASGNLQGNNDNLRTIQSYTSGQYLGRTGALSGTAAQNWRSWSNLLAYRTTGYGATTYYFKATSATTFETGTAANGNRYNFYTVTFEDIAEGLSDIEITGGVNSFNAAGSATYSHTNADYFDQDYTHYNFNGNNYYVNSSDVSSTTNPATTITDASAYSWSLSDNATGYATVNSTGTVTVTNIPTSGSLNIILTCTVSSNGHTTTATKNIFLTLTGVSSTTVTLDDREDHNWSYYQAAGNLPDGYPTEYLSSPDPRNVKITYRGGSVNNASAVAISALDGEGQNEMVYYKTLEKSVPGMTGDYPYTVISNPFSKRPRTNGTTGTNGFWGFAGWKVISGGEYISEYANDETLPLDETIHFTNLNTNYTPNCTSAEVVFEATWRTATVKTGSTAQTFTGGTYETNFWVLTGNPDNAVTVPGNSTMSARYPDGTVNFSGDFTRSITAGGDNAKVEWVNMSSTNAVSAANHTFTMGRGVVNSANGGDLSACNTNANCNQTVKIESGTYATLHNFTVGLNQARTCDQLLILGCDYDRAKNDNAKLIIRGDMYIGSSIQLNRAANSLYTRTYIKSGNFGSTVNVSGNTDYTGAGGSQTYYYSVSGTHNAGRRFLCVEGGRLMGIAGGMDETNSQTTTARAFDLRVRGTAQVDGVVYGAAEFANARGTRTMIFTGGTINGWVAGGANGTQSTNGALTGATYLYVGGNTTVNSNSSTQVLNRAVGGNVFGAGCGNSASSSSGQILTYNTNVVVADDATVERGVYGGGSYGYTTNTANIFVLGGTVNGANGGVNGTTYQASITGGVFGGACQNQGGTVNIYMDGGLVKGGVYGGSNATGTISNNVTMQINGGQVGTSSKTANIHGGGYGSATRVSQNVEITLGTTTQTTPGVTVYGDVYGGSALGYVNGTAATNTYHTYVTLNKGIINGSLYGGGLGDGSTAANVYGPVQVKVYGGSVRKTDANGANGSGGVYGANNVNGAPQRSVTVDIYGTDPAPSANEYALFAVYGGGNQADYTYGNGYPKVTVHNCDNSIEYVYGGGNAAAVASTDVKIYGGNTIGTVFGGGNGTVTAANVTGNASTNIYGGTIGRVFGGSNSQGSIGGTISVNVNKQADTDPNGSSTACAMKIGELYGGGNMAASNVGSITIGCTGDLTAGHSEHPENIGTTLEGIGYVYGGANQANITGDITLTMNSGIVGNLFGGNNTSGSISGGIQVNIEKDNSATCASDWYVGNVFGGGNLAQYTIPSGKSLAVNVLNGAVSGNVYGGGKGDAGDHTKGQVTGNPVVTIGDNTTAAYVASVAGDVYGGGDAGNVVGTPVVNVVNKCNTTISGDVYGGGNAADVNGTDVNIDGGTITGMVFGGGHGNNDPSDLKVADVNGNVDIDITGGTINKVFAGSNLNGTISGSVTLDINKSTASGACDMIIGEVYGGGNEAAGKAGTITVGCTGALTTQASNPTQIGTTLEGIGAVYGGANKADIGTSSSNSNITLNINSGMVGNVYGGNNTSGDIHGTIQVNINKTSDACGWYVGDVFGGGNLADYGGTPDVNIIAGTVSGSVFGGGNAADVAGSDVEVRGGQINGGVYGGCNTSGNTGAVTIALTGGQVGTSGTSADVFGGGFGSQTTTSGDIGVTLNGTTIYGDLYGGSALGQVNGSTSHTTTLNINSNTLHGTIYGGGKGDNSTTAVSNGNVIINYNTANTALTGLYGGANVNGNVKGDIAVNVLANVGVSGANNSIDVFGGGLGHLTNTEGNVTVNVGAADGSNNPVIYGDIYGGSALGNVNNAVADLTTVNILNGTVHGNVYGGGLGAATLDGNGYIASVTTEAIVNGTVHVNIGHATVNTSAPTIDGKVFGCNNLAGSPKGNVYVDVYRTAHTTANTYPSEPASASAIPVDPDPNSFAISEVYGGGNLAHYTTTLSGASTHVRIHNCDNTIQYVYGGGNAANTVANDVTIDGGRFEYIFGGGNGAGTGNPGANVDGNATVHINGGIINYTFGGSNTLGVVHGVSSMTFADSPTCTRMVKELYGGGNKAPGGTVEMTIPCGVSGLNVVFGGSRMADIGSETDFNNGEKKNVTLTIEGGELTQVFGGNNLGGTIWGDVTLNLKGGTIVDAFGGNNAGGNVKGIITVNVEEDESLACPLVLTNVFGGGKDAAYTPASATISSPLVYIKHKKSGTSITGSVFGGGQGATATVTAKPVVTIGDLTTASYIATIAGDVYGGGDAANVVGTTTVLVQKCNTVINGDVYGGGNAADVDATSVTITGGTITGTGHGMVFGGGHGDLASLGTPHTDKIANVNGNVAVVVNGGTINKVFAGSNLNGTISGTTSVNVDKSTASGACALKIGEVYGGGNVAAGNAGTITIGCTGTLVALTSGQHYGVDQEGITYVYGGANQADINNDIEVNIISGIVENVFGGNNTSGDINGTITVNIEKDASASCASNWYVGNVFGGGNQATYGSTTTPAGNYPVVNVINGLVSGDVFGGGLGLSGDPTKGVVNGNPQVTVNGSGASVNGGVYGGGSLAPTVGNPVVTLTTGALTKVFGGGKAADVTGAPTVNINGGTVSTGVYGGCDSQGSVSGKITVNVTNGTIGDPSINLTSPNYITADVFGGGYGQSTNTAGNVEVNFGTTATSHNDFPKLYGNVYGGSALGNVNKDGNNTTIVNILNGTLYTTATTGTTANGLTYYVYHGGNVFGGGLGDRANLGTGHSDVAAQVKGKVTVNIGSASNTKVLNPDEDLNGGFAIIQGNVYGSNNTNGSPQDDVTVNIYRTERGEKDQITYTGNDATYALNNVFGGGNEADYTASGKTASVNIFGCYNSIYRVFGGGNAAAAPNVHTTIQGGRFAEVFGGGNGERGAAYAANITGNVNLEIHGGIVGEFYVGSNQNGAISGTSSVVVDQTSGCEEVSITEFYCGGKYADFVGNIEATITCSQNMNVTNLYGGCKEANVVDWPVGHTNHGSGGNVHLIVKGGTYENVYGGSRGTPTVGADISGNVTLDILGGTVTNAIFGGSNVKGNIAGTITVNVEQGGNDACELDVAVADVYGGGNKADYTPTTASSHPEVNIKNATVKNVYGGGLEAEVTSNPKIHIKKGSKILGNVYGGGNMGQVNGSPTVIINGKQVN